MHFYYSYLVMRIGGEHALADAKAGKDGGFKNATFVEAGKRLRELGALEPFQPGYLATKHAELAGMFGDGKAAMDLMGQWLLGMQGPNSTGGKGLAEEDIGILSFPIVPGGKGKATDTLGGVNGWLVSKSAPPEAVDFLKFFSQEKYAKEAAAKAAYIPVVKGSESAFTDPLFKRLADDLAKTTYHQNYFDQDLGPSVGRVINDVSVAVAAGQIIRKRPPPRSRKPPTSNRVFAKGTNSPASPCQGEAETRDVTGGSFSWPPRLTPKPSPPRRLMLSDRRG